VTEKELKKLNRYQLLELLVAQTKRADELQARLDELEQLLADRDIEMDALGSIAEASLRLNGVFQAAQEAADAYLLAAKKRAVGVEFAARKKAADILAEANEKVKHINDSL